ERALNVGPVAKAVLFSGEQQITDRRAAAAQRLDHRLGLVWRHDRILVALEEDHRTRKALDVIERRALAIERFALRVGADQPNKVARLEFMRVARRRRDVADAVIAGAAAKYVMKHQRGERRVAACATAADHHAFRIDKPALDEEPCAVDAVLNVDDAPLTLQAVAGRAAEARAAAVIYVEDCDAAAGPIFDPPHEPR